MSDGASKMWDEWKEERSETRKKYLENQKNKTLVKDKKNKLEFDVEYPSINGEDSSIRTITVPEHVVTSSIINYCVQNYGWERNNIKFNFTKKGELKFMMFPCDIRGLIT